MARIASRSAAGSRPSDLAGVVADRDALGADHQVEAGLGEIVDRVDLASPPGIGDDELVAGEDDRLLDQPLVEELVGKVGVGGGEDVGLGALADLRRELVGAREREPLLALGGVSP